MLFSEVLDPHPAQVRLVLFQKLELAGNFCFVGQEQQQAARRNLRLGKEQGAHPSPIFSLFFLTEDSNQCLFMVLFKVLTAGGLIPQQADTLSQFHVCDG